MLTEIFFVPFRFLDYTQKLKEQLDIHPGLGECHLSELSGKVYHRKITLKVQYDRNVPLESKVSAKTVIDIVFQIP